MQTNLQPSSHFAERSLAAQSIAGWERRGNRNCGYHNDMLFSGSPRAGARRLAATEVCSF
jgi:hypothetical protein